MGPADARPFQAGWEAMFNLSAVEKMGGFQPAEQQGLVTASSSCWSWAGLSLTSLRLWFPLL